MILWNSDAPPLRPTSGRPALRNGSHGPIEHALERAGAAQGTYHKRRGRARGGARRKELGGGARGGGFTPAGITFRKNVIFCAPSARSAAAVRRAEHRRAACVCVCV